jgi:hypothetical protein
MKYTDAKKLINQKNYTVKKKKITQLEIEYIKKELQDDRSSHVNESEGKQLN